MLSKSMSLFHSLGVDLAAAPARPLSYRAAYPIVSVAFRRAGGSALTSQPHLVPLGGFASGRIRPCA